MKVYVGVTDESWFRYLAERPTLTEANFWLPNPPRTFGAISPGEPMIFKTHYPDNRLVGGGVLSDYRRLPLSLAWSAFGEANGSGSESEMRVAIGRYRRDRSPAQDPEIGCLMLRDTAFFPPGAEVGAPADFAKNIVRGKSYVLGEAPVEIETAFARLLGLSGDLGAEVDLAWHQGGPMYGAARSVVPRLGQSAFAAVVGEAYQMRCAITGNRVRPILQAAHIRPVASQGQHRVDNGLLLRADVHIMFDQGYLGIHPERRELMVSPKIRQVFGNGREFYEREGSTVGRPARRGEEPNAEFLTWHLDEVFQR